MTDYKRLIKLGLIGFGSFFLTSTAGAQAALAEAATTGASEDVVVLSPFVVNAEDDQGYAANSTLAGARLKTDLVDTAAAINVFTPEFMQDLGATDLTEVIEYSTNTANDIGVGQSNNDNNTFSIGAETVNVRGLQGTRTRNYFEVFTAVDNYNVERIEESRGPNSILFGIGSPAGIINANTKRAQFARTFLRVGTQFNDGGGYRGTFDANVPTKNNGPLAVRVNAVYSHLDDPTSLYAYKKVKAIDLAASLKLSKRVLFRIEAEASRQNSVRAKTRSTTDRVGDWIDSDYSRYVLDQVSGYTLPTGESLASLGIANPFNGNDRVAYVDNSDSLLNTRLTHRSDGSYNLFYADNHPELWDRSVNDGGPGQMRDATFHAYTAALEVQITNHTFLELAYNHQDTHSLSYQFNDQGLHADVDAQYPDGTPNPYAGKLMIEGQWLRWRKTKDDDSYRVTLSHELDLGKWGDYRFAFMGEKDRDIDENEQKREVWVDANGQGLFNADPRNARNRTYRRNYIEDEGNWKEYYVSSPAFGLISGMPVTAADGTVVTAYSAWRNQNSGQDFNNRLKTYLVGLQARYFKDHLVFGLGYRADKLRQRLYTQHNEAVSSGLLTDLNERWTDHSSWTDANYSGNTKTYGVVYHINHNFRLMYNHSDNFGLPSNSRFEYPDHAPARNTQGVGFDYGIGFRLFGDKISGRVTRFETDSSNIYQGAYNLQAINDDLRDALLANGDIAQSQYDAMDIQGTGSIKDQHVEGYEVSLTANLTKNWRLIANYAKTDGFQSNSYPDQREYRDGDVNGRLGGFGGLTFYEAYPNTPISGQTNYTGASTVGEYINLFKEDLASDLAIDGVALAKNIPKKANLFTRYSFLDGGLKGLFVGGGVRYHSAADLGLGTDSNGNPIALYGTAYTAADAFIGYTITEFMGLKNVRVQLNVNNVFDFSDYIITARNASTGDVTRVTYLPPRLFKLSVSTTF